MVETGLLAFDVGAKRHAFASRFDQQKERGELTNELVAMRRFLLAQKAKCRHLRVVVEATGVYFLDLALTAIEIGAEVMVINPKRAHHFAQALSTRSKTDAIDAGVLLVYLERMAFRPWQPPSADALAIRQFGRHIAQLTDERTAAKNRLHALENASGSPAMLRTDLKRGIANLDQRIERLSKAALKIIRAEPGLSAQFDALDSIVGVAEASALPLLGELLMLPRDMNARACVSHAGLDIRMHQSGTSVNKPPRLSKQGNKHLRRALFMPAMTACTRDPHAREFKERLVAKGKKPIQAIAALMRKLLTAAWALMRNPGTYDGSLLFAKIA